MRPAVAADRAGPVVAGGAPVVAVEAGRSVAAGEDVVVVDLLCRRARGWARRPRWGGRRRSAGRRPRARLDEVGLGSCATRRPRRSYQGPSPTRSMACTGLPVRAPRHAEEGAPALGARAGHRASRRSRRQILSAPDEAVGFAVAQVAAEAVLAARQPLHRREAGDEEAEIAVAAVGCGTGPSFAGAPVGPRAAVATDRDTAAAARTTGAAATAGAISGTAAVRAAAAPAAGAGARAASSAAVAARRGGAALARGRIVATAGTTRLRSALDSSAFTHRDSRRPAATAHIHGEGRFHGPPVTCTSNRPGRSRRGNRFAVHECRPSISTARSTLATTRKVARPKPGGGARACDARDETVGKPEMPSPSSA